MPKQLPQKTYDFHAVEDRLYRQWMDENCFAPVVDKAQKPFVIVIPPPNITGQLHMGHALDNVLPVSYTHLASLLMSTESLFGCLFGCLLLGEPFTLRILIGTALIFLAVVISETKLSMFKKRYPRAHAALQAQHDAAQRQDPPGNAR